MKVALLAGGTGGAKLAHGFQQTLSPGDLTVIVNVADDTELFGLHISPDVDSVIYTLSGLLDGERGWGVRGDTFTALELLGRYGAPTWFRIGDADLATHVRRTQLLREGASLTDATAALTDALGVPSTILPATDDRIRTVIVTDAGELDFQDYFVARRQEPEVRGVRLEGLDRARPTASVRRALDEADLIVLAPSNPIVSIGPILELPGMRAALEAAAAPRVAVSPIIGGRALKGPADRMLISLGHESSARGVARIYAGLIDRFAIDDEDRAQAAEIEALGVAVDVLPTIMHTDADRAALASALIDAARRR
jgi:LPPG:FO 2-phospho-L-lactate transferase